MTAATVLIVESDPIVRSPLAQYLRDCGYVVLEADGAPEAMSLLERDAERTKSIALVLSAVEFEGGPTGFELRQWITSRRPGIKVLLAGSVDGAVKAAGALCEAGPQLGRPYEPQAVIDWIKRLLSPQK